MAYGIGKNGAILVIIGKEFRLLNLCICATMYYLFLAFISR